MKKSTLCVILFSFSMAVASSHLAAQSQHSKKTASAMNGNANKHYGN
jgi:hypothetical protein